MRYKLTLGLLITVGTVIFVDSAMAEQLTSNGIMDDVLEHFHNAAFIWRETITTAASRFFWALTTISMVWTFGMMALRKADIGEFFAEFVRFTMFTGFYWWLLTNATDGMNIAGTIIKSLQTLGAQASNLHMKAFTPSSVIDVGFQIFHNTISNVSWMSPFSSLGAFLLAASVLIIVALVAINLLLVMVSAWILLYAGVFFLGFGGSRWTSDIAINYYKTVLSIAVQLMSMILLIAIGQTFLNHYYTQISKGITLQELAVILVISLTLLSLVNKVPLMISGIMTGANLGAIGNTVGVGTAISATAAAATGAVMTGKAVAGAVSEVAGGASALKAAYQKAASSMNFSNDTPRIGDVLKQSKNSDKGQEVATMSSSPYAQAAGYANMDSSSNIRGFDTVVQAAKLATGTTSELAKGIGSQIKKGLQERIKETTGGKIAQSIRESMEPKEESQENQFWENSLSKADINDEVAAFVNKRD
nr:TrbL/VirB6 plasmid conjugal transfer protein [Bartonella sp. 1-1C]